MSDAEKDSSEFPEAEIRKILKDEWELQTGASSEGGDPFLAGGGVMSVGPAMDSLRAVETLLSVEKVLPFELPDSTIRKGGYVDENDYTEHIVNSVHKKWDEKLGTHMVGSKNDKFKKSA